MVPGTSGAVVVYSDFGPGDTYNTGEAFVIGSALGHSFETAAAFTPTINCVFAALDIAAGYISGTNEIEVDLARDNSGVPGAVLESFTFTGLALTTSGGEVLHADSVLNPSLLAGDQYWVVASAPASDPEAGWFFNSTGAIGQDYNRDGAGWYAALDPTGAPDPTGAFEIDATTVVPEPATMTLLGLGLAGLVGRQIRRHGR
jgi:hypothetical protein